MIEQKGQYGFVPLFEKSIEDPNDFVRQTFRDSAKRGVHVASTRGELKRKFKMAQIMAAEFVERQRDAKLHQHDPVLLGKILEDLIHGRS